MSQSGQEGQDSTGTGGSGSDGAQDQGQQGGTGSDSGQGTGSGGGTGADGEQQNSDKDTGNDTVSRADFDRLRTQLSAADRKREDAEKELKTIKDKDLSELEKSKQELADLTKERDDLLGEVQKLRLNNAFLAANTITWQNADVALDIALSKGYLADVVDDNGTVDTKKMGTSLKKLADEHKYLVKVEDSEGDDGKGGSGSGGQHGASGQSGPRGTNNANDDKTKEKRLRHTFPALGRR